MSARVLLNLLNELGKRDKCEALRKPGSAISNFKLLTTNIYVKNNKWPHQAYAGSLVGPYLISNF